TSWGGGIRSVNLLKHHTALGGLVPAVPSLAPTDSSNDVFGIQNPNSKPVVLPNLVGLPKTFCLINNYVIPGTFRIPGATNSISLNVGTAIPSELRETPNYLVVDWQGAPKFRNRTQPRIGDRVKAGTAHEEIRTGWVAVKSQYFAMVLSPATNVTVVS